MLNHKGTEKLETNRLILRKFRMGDYLVMYNNWACEEAGFCNQGIIDEVWYSILKDEWKF